MPSGELVRQGRCVTAALRVGVGTHRADLRGVGPRHPRARHRDQAAIRVSRRPR